jgi:ABC-2 type transport system permease protein
MALETEQTMDAVIAGKVARSPVNIDPQSDRAGLLTQLALMFQRSLLVLARSPASVIPNLIIGAFFLFVFNSAIGGSAGFLPGLEGVDYLAFILPFSIISGALNAPAGQAMIRDLESGYFDKLSLTPVSRVALVLGHIVAGGVAIAAQSLVLIGVATLAGFSPAGGIGAIAIAVGFAAFIGAGFGGFTLGVALLTGSSGAAQGASFLFFPLSFLSTALFPKEYLEGWLKTVANINPVSYILDGLRSLFISGWDGAALTAGIIACVGISVVPFLFAMFALRVRTRRK